MTKYISAAQLAERYSVSVDTIWRWASTGRLPPPVNLSPSCTRWNAVEIDNHDAEREAHRVAQHAARGQAKRDALAAARKARTAA